jgi:hypothetical protein
VEHVLNNPQATFKSGERAWWSILPYLWSEALFSRGTVTPVEVPIAA